MIKTNDPKLKEIGGEVFKDSDFEDSVEIKIKAREKPIMYKD